MDATEPAPPRGTRSHVDSWGLFFGRCMIGCAVLFFATAVLDAAFHNPARVVRGNVLHAVESHGSIPLDFARIAPFEWDDLCIIGPYTPQDRIDALLGFRWENAYASDLEMSDSHCLLVFVQGESVVGFSDIRRSECDFSALAGDDGLRVPKAEAVFEVDHTFGQPTAHPRSFRPQQAPRVPLLAVR